MINAMLLILIATVFLVTDVLSTPSSPLPTTNPSDKKWTAIVVGGGPAGLALALGLDRCKNCARVHLIERQPEFDARGANFVLASNGQRALEELSPGTKKEMEAMGVVSDMFPDYPAILIPWYVMRDVLAERVKRRLVSQKHGGKIKLHMGKTFTRIVDNPEDRTVSVYLEDSNGEESGEREMISGQLLIGADGVNSGVRKHLGLKSATKIGWTVFRGHVDDARGMKEIEPLLEKGLVPLRGNFGIDGVVGSVFSYHPKIPGKLAWVLGTSEPVVPEKNTPLTILDTEKSSLESEEDGNESNDLQLMRALVSRTSAPDIHFEPFPEARVVDFSEKALRPLRGRWGGKGLVTLIGDAAHAFPSVDGQGGSQAFEDAIVLTRLLEGRQSLASEKTMEEILEEFEKSRMGRVKKIHADQTKRSADVSKNNKFEPWPKDFMEWVFEGV